MRLSHMSVGLADTQTIERSDVDLNEDTDSDRPKFFHYVKKAKIVESAVTGTVVEALCGEIFTVTKAPKPDSPVCPRCKEMYDLIGMINP
nr:DUF3039 domain-containing protein [Segniliparus rugosus]